MDITATLVTPEGAQVGSWPCGGFGAVVIDDSSRRTMSLTVMMMTMTLIHCLFAIVSEFMTMIIRIRLNVVMMVMMMVTMLMISYDHDYAHAVDEDNDLGYGVDLDHRRRRDTNSMLHLGLSKSPDCKASPEFRSGEKHKW